MQHDNRTCLTVISTLVKTLKTRNCVKTTELYYITGGSAGGKSEAKNMADFGVC